MNLIHILIGLVDADVVDTRFRFECLPDRPSPHGGTAELRNAQIRLRLPSVEDAKSLKSIQ